MSNHKRQLGSSFEVSESSFLIKSNIYKFSERDIKEIELKKKINFILLKTPEEILDCLKIKLSHSSLIDQLKSTKMKTEILTKGIGLEHPNVKKVIEIAEEILSQNKTLTIEELYNLAKKRLKIPKNGLLFIIQFLVNKKILIEGSKLTRNTVLSNNIRKRIYRYIVKNPGVHFSTLRKKTLSQEMGSSGQLVWHIEMLAKFNYIKKVKVGNFSVLLPYELDEGVGVILFILRDRINKKILQLLVERECILKSEIYKIIEEKREDVYYRINNLLNFGLLITNQDLDKEICLNSEKKEIIVEILSTTKMIY